ncbi:MAG: hypothetical protein ACTSX6_02435 [Candidatus Heimdallarchaeaceae archaeon]
MSVSLDGTYIIYNPDKTMNVTIIAPFQSVLFILLSNLSVTVNGTDFKWYEISSYDNENITYWEDYIDESSRNFVAIDNVVLEENTTTIVRFCLESLMFLPILREEGYFTVFYDVGTSRLWKGNTSEHIEFQVYGYQPFSYSNYSSAKEGEKCQIVDFTYYTSYIWKWENERIYENKVYVKFWYDKDKGFTFKLQADFYSIYFSLITTGAFIYINTKNKKRKCKR